MRYEQYFALGNVFEEDHDKEFGLGGTRYHVVHCNAELEHEQAEANGGSAEHYMAVSIVTPANHLVNGTGIARVHT